MFREDSSDEAAFRAEVREWLEANLPAALRGRTDRPPPDEIMPWYRALSARGWVAPHWPREHGGMGASLAQQIVLTQELARLSAPQLPIQGINHIGPILMRYGTEEQKARHLPPILSGDAIWAQGYSEPGAGSDLASLSTRGELRGGRFTVTGGKIWQTWAHHSDWMFTLVRTDPEAKVRQAGISFILIDLKTPGIEIRPITTIAGEEEFSQVFLDGVEVPQENLVGPLHGGWKIATALLATERLFTSNPQHALEVVERIKAVAKRTGIDRDASFRDRLAELSISIAVQAAMFWQAVDMAGERGGAGPGRIDDEAGRDGEPATRDGPPCRGRGTLGRRRGPDRDRFGRGRRDRHLSPVAPGDDLWRFERDPAQRPRQARARASRRMIEGRPSIRSLRDLLGMRSSCLLTTPSP